MTYYVFYISNIGIILYTTNRVIMCHSCGGTCSSNHRNGSYEQKTSRITFPYFQLDDGSYISIGHFRYGPFCFLQVPTISGIVTQDINDIKVDGGTVFWPPCRSVYQVIMMIINEVPFLGFFRIAPDSSVQFKFYPFNGTSPTVTSFTSQSRCSGRIPAGTRITIRGLGQSWFHRFQ